MTDFTGSTEASQPFLNHQVEIHGREVTLSFPIKALDGFFSSKIIQAYLEKETLQYRGEIEKSREYSLKAEITDTGDWEPSLKDSIEVVFFARDMDWDSQFKRVLIKILAP